MYETFEGDKLHDLPYPTNLVECDPDLKYQLKAILFRKGLKEKKKKIGNYYCLLLLSIFLIYLFIV